jgi:hypothetical protein
MINPITWLQVSLWRMNRETFFRDLSNAIVRKVGISTFLERELKNARMVKDTNHEAVVSIITQRLESGNGNSLQEMMRTVCPSSDYMLLATVDDANDKVQALEKMADAIAFKKESMMVLAKNLLVPLIAVPIVSAICWLSADIIKSIEKSAPPSIWTGFNAFSRDIATLVTSNGLYFLIGTAVAIALLIYALPRWTGTLRSKIENWPAFDLFRKYQTAIVLSSLAMMMANKKSLRESLEVLSASANPWLRWQLRKIIFSMEDNPSDYAAAFGQGLLPNKIRGRLLSLSDSGSFQDAMIQLGSSEAKKLSSAVEQAAISLNVLTSGILLVLAVTLSVGQMTIAGAIANATGPAAMRVAK